MGMAAATTTMKHQTDGGATVFLIGRTSGRASEKMGVLWRQKRFGRSPPNMPSSVPRSLRLPCRPHHPVQCSWLLGPPSWFLQVVFSGLLLSWMAMIVPSLA